MGDWLFVLFVVGVMALIAGAVQLWLYLMPEDPEDAVPVLGDTPRKRKAPKAVRNIATTDAAKDAQ